MLKYDYIPDVKLKCNEILDKLDTLCNNGLICDILYAIYSQLVQIQDYFYDKGEELIGLAILYFGILPVYFKAIFHECDWLIDTPRR